VQALSTYILDACKQLKMPAFERWYDTALIRYPNSSIASCHLALTCACETYCVSRLIDSKLEERQFKVSFSDPVLSTSVTAGFESSKRLMEEIHETGAMTRAEAKKLVQDLCRRTSTAVGEIAQLHALHQGRPPLKKGDRVELEGRAPVYTLVYHRKSWKKPFCIKLNSIHYDKLRSMFQRVHETSNNDKFRLQWTESATGKATRTTHSFHLLLMALLLRYSSLSGGQLLLDLRGGGMQGAVHGRVFQALHDMFPHDTLLEGFGSPLNAYLPAFGSAFAADLDWHFGSIGNFLDLTINEGCCEANPPFSPGMMSAMAERIDHNLEKANESGTAVTFVVIVPSAGDDADPQRAAAKRFGGVSLQKMLTSPSCRHHVLLSAKEHGYIEGAQHMRPTRYKESLYNTSVIVLQSSAARQRALDLVRLKEKIREAFASRHKEETERRKLNDDRDLYGGVELAESL
jgi:phosphorylated CTD-interacting factor 1